MKMTMTIILLVRSKACNKHVYKTHLFYKHFVNSRYIIHNLFTTLLQDSKNETMSAVKNKTKQKNNKQTNKKKLLYPNTLESIR